MQNNIGKVIVTCKNDLNARNVLAYLTPISLPVKENANESKTSVCLPSLQTLNQ